MNEPQGFYADPIDWAGVKRLTEENLLRKTFYFPFSGPLHFLVSGELKLTSFRQAVPSPSRLTVLFSLKFKIWWKSVIKLKKEIKKNFPCSLTNFSEETEGNSVHKVENFRKHICVGCWERKVPSRVKTPTPCFVFIILCSCAWLTPPKITWNTNSHHQRPGYFLEIDMEFPEERASVFQKFALRHIHSPPTCSKISPKV